MNGRSVRTLVSATPDLGPPHALGDQANRRLPPLTPAMTKF